MEEFKLQQTVLFRLAQVEAHMVAPHPAAFDTLEPTAGKVGVDIGMRDEDQTTLTLGGSQVMKRRLYLVAAVR